MVAVLPVQAGQLPDGGREAVAEACGLAVLIGERVDEAADALSDLASDLLLIEAGPFAPARWSAALVGSVGDAVVIVPASADGRSLAPRLAHELGRPLLATALAVWPRGARLVRGGGRLLEDVEVTGPFVATLQPGARGVLGDPRRAAPRLTRRPLASAAASGDPPRDAEVLAVEGPDPATIDLADAARIVAGGAGLGGPDDLALLRAVGLRLGASIGGTRVVTDRGWLPPERQIGTTGVTVDPTLYLAFGISGAVQHLVGIGHPAHVVSVNLDPACPMASHADLALVADAPATLRALAALLGVDVAAGVEVAVDVAAGVEVPAPPSAGGPP